MGCVRSSGLAVYAGHLAGAFPAAGRKSKNAGPGMNQARRSRYPAMMRAGVDQNLKRAFK